MIKLKSKKGLLAASVIALAVLALAIINRSAFYSDGVLSVYSLLKFAAVYVLMCFLMAVDFNLSTSYKNILSLIMFVSGPVLCFETVRTIVSAPIYDSYIYLDNLMFYALVQLLAFAVTQSLKISLIFEFALSWVLHTANQIVLMLRGTPLVPTDFYAIDTAMTVTTPSEWHFDLPILIGTAGFVALAALTCSLGFDYKKGVIRIAAGVISLALAAGAAAYIYDLDYLDYATSTFDTESTNNVNGVALSFYINFRKMSFDEPEGYSEKELFEYLDKYEDPEPPKEELPNIIVIMNESFSDFNYMGRLKTDNDYLPYFNKLIETCPHGKLLVSVLGGGTCNTEFEFLTGLSMMYMPNGCYTYMQHIKREIPSMATYLKDYGYTAVAMHPFYEVCWKRNMVYDFMGFDDFISGEDMTDYKSHYVSADRWEKGFGDDVEYVRTLISDNFFYDKVIERFEQKGSEKLFIFGVTVQNHSGYEYDGDDFVTDVHITNYDGDFPRAEQYLSLVKKSDEALQKLISYFENVDEKTIIVFFGDHQPNVEADLINQLAPYRNMIVNSFLTRYETPFAIWANYDIGKKDLGITSANFLGLKLFEYAGVPLSKEYQMIKEAEAISPAMNTWGYFDRFIVWCDRSESYKDNILNIYNFYTYYTLSHKK